MFFEKKAVFFLILALSAAIGATEEEDPEVTTLRYGLDSEIVTLLGRLAGENRGEFSAEALELFTTSKSPAVREAAAGYFVARGDAALVPVAMEAMSVDTEDGLLTMLLRYVTAVFSGAAPVVSVDTETREALVESVRAVAMSPGADREKWFDAALGALGAVGTAEDGAFLGALLTDSETSSSRKQVVIQALGNLKAVSAVPELVALVENPEAGTALRVQGAEALGNIGATAGEAAETVAPVLQGLYRDASPFLRAAAVKAMALLWGARTAPATADAAGLILGAIRDDQWRVRLAGIAAAKDLRLEGAAPFLLLRGKNDPEAAVRYAAFEAMAALDFPEGTAFLEGVVADKKAADTARARAAAALLENGKGAAAVTTTARETLGDDKKKPLRYALGKEFAKRENPEFAEVCLEFLASKDVATQGIGLDMWAKGRYAAATPVVTALSQDEKAGPNRKKAERVLQTQ
jgi:HEAT repeat protein